MPNKYSYKMIETKSRENRLYKSNPEISYIEHYENIYGFRFDEYLKKAYKVLSDTQLEYKYLINKVKLFYEKPILTEVELKNYFVITRPSTYCADKSINEITDLLLKDNDKVKLEFFERDNYGDIRVFCIPVHIPDLICILTDKIHKAYDLKYLLHEIGYAVSLSNTFCNTELLQSYLYNEIMQEAYAVLYENLLIYNYNFRDTFQIKLSRFDIENSRFEGLYRNRLLAAQVIYNKEYYSNKDEAYLRDFYQDTMEKGLCISLDNDTDSNYNSTDFDVIQKFIGTMIGGKIQSSLETKFGLEWYKNKSALNELHHLFSYGGLVKPNNYEKFSL
jgi:hypothetical protein